MKYTLPNRPAPTSEHAYKAIEDVHRRLGLRPAHTFIPLAGAAVLYRYPAGVLEMIEQFSPLSLTAITTSVIVQRRNNYEKFRPILQQVKDLRDGRKAPLDPTSLLEKVANVSHALRVRSARKAAPAGIFLALGGLGSAAGYPTSAKTYLASGVAYTLASGIDRWNGSRLRGSIPVLARHFGVASPTR
ncbi:MAG TPA: hypothetical protein PKB15_06805 [Acidimicrobiia bacterium]|nr:hypothetical protein [Acidimicrobiia bacterium]